jgi:hypothetical protein
MEMEKGKQRKMYSFLTKTNKTLTNCLKQLFSFLSNTPVHRRCILGGEEKRRGKELQRLFLLEREKGGNEWRKMNK